MAADRPGASGPGRAGDPGAVDLLERLHDLALHLDVPTGADLVPAVRGRLSPAPARVARPAVWRRRPTLGVAVSVAALVVVTVLVVPAPRHAIARWFGIGAVEITRTDAPPTTAATDLREMLGVGTPTPVTEALSQAPFSIELPASLGPPAAAFVDQPVEGAVTLVWAPADGYPEVDESGVGVLLTGLAGGVDRALLQKQVGLGVAIDTARVDGAPAYWLHGALHELYVLDADGDVVLDASRLAANTLLWENGGVTFRLESTLDRASALALAEALNAGGR